jgi:hypothetical protein
MVPSPIIPSFPEVPAGVVGAVVGVVVGVVVTVVGCVAGLVGSVVGALVSGVTLRRQPVNRHAISTKVNAITAVFFIVAPPEIQITEVVLPS